MNDRVRTRFDAFIRVAQFGTDNAADFPAGNIARAQFDEIVAVITLINQLEAQHAVSFGEARFAFAGKDDKRENLREDLREIARTARSMAYQFPGIDLKFRLGNNLSDANLLALGRAFRQESGEFEADMIAYDLPADFRDDLQTDTDAFEQSLSEPGTAIDAQVAATAELAAAVRRGMIAKRILDGVIKNKYRNNVGKLAAWLSASHVEKAPKKKKVEPKPLVSGGS